VNQHLKTSNMEVYVIKRNGDYKPYAEY